MWRQNVVLICIVAVVTSDNRNEEKSSRNGRIFTFNTNNDDELRVELQFSIPFLTIPTKKATDSIYGLWNGEIPPININPATLAVAGAIILGTTVLLPVLVKSYSNHYPHDKYSRLLDTAEFSNTPVLEFASQMLSDGQTVRGCALRVACWTAQRSHNEALSIWHQLRNNNIVSTIVNATAIEDAIVSGRNGRDCTTYTPCLLREEHIPFLLSNLSVFSSAIGK